MKEKKFRKTSVSKRVDDHDDVVIIETYEQALDLFDYQKYLVPYLQSEPFFAGVSRFIRKRPSLAVPTAGLCYNFKADEFQLLLNPLFFYTLPDLQIYNIFKHEFLHFVCRHCVERRRDPAEAHNIAADAAINSLIVKDDNTRNVNNNTLSLPRFAVVPGVRPAPPPPEVMKRMTTEQIKYMEAMADTIEHWPPLEATEFYFSEMIKFNQDHPRPKGRPCPIHGKCRCEQAAGECDEHNEDGEGGDCGGDSEGDKDEDKECTCGYGSIDDHSGWDSVPEDASEYVRARAQAIVERAVRDADSKSNGWGSIPQHMREKIRRSVSHIVNWREVLRHFVGSLVRSKKTTSIGKINRKYPYIHPGTKRGYATKLLIAVDESGSVPNGCVELFFAEIASLTRQVDVDIFSFDAECDPSEIVTWKRGREMPLYRARCGGTDFNAPTRVANDPRYRGRWDALIILTDGLAPQPEASRVTRAWGIAPECNPMFETDELLFKIERNSPIKKGAWY